MERTSRISTVQNRCLLVASILLLMSLSGCVNMVHNMVIKDIKRISEFYADLNPVEPGYGRVIIYWEPKPMLASMGRFNIQGDTGYLTLDFASQTGTIIDLPEGNYLLSSGGVLNKTEVNLQVRAGEVACYNSETLYNVMTGAMSGTMNPVKTQECFSNLTEQDIRCNLKSCQVLTVIPAKDSQLVPYSSADSHTRIEQISKDFDTPDDRSRIYITRRLYTLGRVKSGLDGKPTMAMESSSYSCYDVEPGFHVITVDDPTGKKGFIVNAEGGENYYFHTDTLDFLPISEGKERVDDYDLLTQGFYKQGL